jgi:hypothetical protein
MPALWPFVEWLPQQGPTNLPPAHAEADVHELGRRVALELHYQPALTTDPAEFA